MGWLVNLLPLVFGLELGRQQEGRGSRQEVSRAMTGKASGHKAFILLLRLVLTHFDGVDTEASHPTVGVARLSPKHPWAIEFLM